MSRKMKFNKRLDKDKKKMPIKNKNDKKMPIRGGLIVRKKI